MLNRLIFKRTVVVVLGVALFILAVHAAGVGQETERVAVLKVAILGGIDLRIVEEARFTLTQQTGVSVQLFNVPSADLLYQDPMLMPDVLVTPIFEPDLAERATRTFGTISLATSNEVGFVYISGTDTGVKYGFNFIDTLIKVSKTAPSIELSRNDISGDRLFIVGDIDNLTEEVAITITGADGSTDQAIIAPGALGGFQVAFSIGGFTQPIMVTITVGEVTITVPAGVRLG
ncbi:MAG: hypothetical protein ACE5JP_12690 [Candidatus Bipolaricaulia bacterium]